MEPLDDLLKKMEREWDQRARKNALYYVNTGRADWSEAEFFQSGRREVEEQILNDMGNICQGKDPGQLRVLEIGCGAGRVTRPLSEVFGEVHGVDVSGEMVRRAREILAGRPNVFLYKNNGLDLSVLGDLKFDFAFSIVVFQHIPRHEVVESYVREVHRVLRPGALFKFQLQGDLRVQNSPDDTWIGAPFSDRQVVEMGRRCGFDPRYRSGSGEQYFCVWFFKNEGAV
ncbi:MAG: class I SAM-dependent methyltransferase [Bryobacteraceae bacterium]|jgi:SAM-dependent methyltransferase